jgi:hypothetical protein
MLISIRNVGEEYDSERPHWEIEIRWPRRPPRGYGYMERSFQTDLLKLLEAAEKTDAKDPILRAKSILRKAMRWGWIPR